MKAIEIFKSFLKIFKKEKIVPPKSYFLLSKEFSNQYHDYSICVQMPVGNRRRSELEIMLPNVYRYDDVAEQELIINGWIKEDLFNTEKWSCQIDHDYRDIVFREKTIN